MKRILFSFIGALLLVGFVYAFTEENLIFEEDESLEILGVASNPFSLGGGWQYRIPITIDAAQIDADLTNFPVYVNLANFSLQFFNIVSSTGADIRIINASNVEMPREIVAITTSTQTGELYFRADAIDDTVNTTFYLYFGNPNALEPVANSDYGRNAVWNVQYLGVWHLNENYGATSFVDSSGNGHTMTCSGSGCPVGVATGLIGRSFHFDETNDELIADFPILNTTTAAWPHSITAWVTTTDVSGNPSIVSQFYTVPSGAADRFSFRADTSGRVTYWKGGSFIATSSASAVTSGNRTYVGYTENSSQSVQIYVNGEANGVAKLDSNDFMNVTTTIGDSAQATGPTAVWRGGIDEVRIATGTLTAAWLKAEFVNINTSTIFYSTSSVQSVGGSVGLMMADIF